MGATNIFFLMSEKPRNREIQIQILFPFPPTRPARARAIRREEPKTAERTNKAGESAE
jgi:hypothetical protein